MVYPQHDFGFAHVAAKFAGVDYKATVLSDQGEVKKTIHEEGSVPVLRTSEGTITTSSAIARYFGRVAADKHLLGKDEFEIAQVDEYMNLIDLEIRPQAKTIMYLLTGRIPCETHHKLNHIVNELKKSLEYYNQVLENQEFLVGDHITLADIQLATYIFYPLSFAVNVPFRNKVLKLMTWFYKITSHEDIFTSIFGRVKLSTKVLKPPQPPKTKEEPKKVEKKKEEKKEKKKVEKKDALPPTKINLEDFKRFIINSKNKVEDLNKFLTTEFEKENWSIWHLKYEIYKDEGSVIHKTGNLCNGFMERAEACRKDSFGVHCVIGDEPNLEIEGVWMWRGLDVMPSMKDHVSFEYYQAKKLDITKSEDVKIIQDFWCGAEGDKMNGKTCQRRSHM